MALKKFKAASSAKEEDARDIIKEIKFMLELQHPNIICCHGAYLKDGQVTMMLDYAAGSCFDILDVFKQVINKEEEDDDVLMPMRASEREREREREREEREREREKSKREREREREREEREREKREREREREREERERGWRERERAREHDWRAAMFPHRIL